MCYLKNDHIPEEFVRFREEFVLDNDHIGIIKSTDTVNNPVVACLVVIFQ